jgi:Spy/CpxP family protein refolding chaperone
MRSTHLAGALLALTFAAAASAQSTTTPPPSAPVAPSPSTAVTRGHHRGHYRALLRGVQLTADQQSKVATIRSQHRTEARTLHQQMGSVRTTLRAARANKDTAALATARTQMRAVRSQVRTMRGRWMSDTRAVLTPAQQSQVDANVAAMRARHAARHKASAQGA